VRGEQEEKEAHTRAKPALYFRAIFFSAFGTFGFEILLVGRNHKNGANGSFAVRLLPGRSITVSFDGFARPGFPAKTAAPKCFGAHDRMSKQPQLEFSRRTMSAEGNLAA